MRRFLNKVPRPALPTEVVEQIINMVARLEIRLDLFDLKRRLHSLRVCALVARSWLPRSRLHLFRHITLQSDLRTRRFLNSLTMSPALGRYAETLQIWPNDDDESSCGWILKALSALPPFFPHLRELVFCRLGVLHPACIAVLSRFRTVESLVLYGLVKQSLREVVLLISRFSQLRRLHVQWCDWEFPRRCYSGKQHNLTTLDMFSETIECERLLLEWALASGSTCALTTFRARSDVAGSVVNRILKTCHSTLRELLLNFWMGDEYLNASEAFELPLLTNHLALQRLALYGHAEYMISVLTRLPFFAPSSLIGIWISDPWNNSFTTKDIENISESLWKGVDLALCDPKFTHLKSVEFIWSRGDPLENPHALFQRALPNSYVRGMLWIRHGRYGRPTRIAPVGAPQYPTLHLEWEHI